MQRLELRVPPPVVTALAALLMWLAAKPLPRLDFDFPSRLALAAALLAAGLALGGTAIWQFRRAKTTVNPMKPRESTALVAGGVFRFSRNPMYLANLLVLLAWLTVVANGAALLVLPVFVAYLDRFQIRPEEAVLRELFRDEYERYCRSVRRWL